MFITHDRHRLTDPTVCSDDLDTLSSKVFRLLYTDNRLYRSSSTTIISYLYLAMSLCFMDPGVYALNALWSLASLVGYFIFVAFDMILICFQVNFMPSHFISTICLFTVAALLVSVTSISFVKCLVLRRFQSYSNLKKIRQKNSAKNTPVRHRKLNIFIFCHRTLYLLPPLTRPLNTKKIIKKQPKPSNFQNTFPLDFQSFYSLFNSFESHS